MNVKNVKIRFNLDKENDRRAYDYLQSAENRTARRSFLLYADLWNYRKDDN